MSPVHTSAKGEGTELAPLFSSLLEFGLHPPSFVVNEPLPTLLSPRPGPAALPSVDRVLGLARLASLLDRYGRDAMQAAVRALLEDKRLAILAGRSPEAVWPPGETWIERDLRDRIEA